MCANFSPDGLKVVTASWDWTAQSGMWLPSAACSARPALRPSVPQREGPAFKPFRRPAHPPQVCSASAAGVPLTGRQAREPAHTPAHHGHASVASGNDINMISYWLGHADINSTHLYVEIDMEMKRKMLDRTPAPVVNDVTPWRQPGILDGLHRLTKARNYVQPIANTTRKTLQQTRRNRRNDT